MISEAPRKEAMKTIGMLGGMSWESTVTYYRLVNEGVKAKLGGLSSAQIALYSVDFAPMEKLQHQGDWAGAGDILVRAAQSVEAAGADFLLICTNTMHLVADAVEAAVHIPLLHIADATGEALVAEGIEKVGLLGTAFTMEQDFYRGRLESKFGLEVVIPGEVDRRKVHEVIYQELCLGVVSESSRSAYGEIIDRLVASGAQGVILGCTEIGLLVSRDHTSVPLFDTTALHAAKAVETALAD